MKRRDLEVHLSKHGCELKREGGSHAIWVNLKRRGWSPVPRHREIKEYLAKRICEQLDVPPPGK